MAPGVAWSSEEAVAAGHTPAIGRTFFLVDPLDGTKAFVRRRREFTINIALIEDRRPVFGLLYAPAVPDFYVTTGPAEAWAARLPPASEPANLAACGLERLHTRTPDPDALAALVSQSHSDATTARFLDRIGSGAPGARPRSNSG